uniref:Uncharacterized protein n=1 Tax=Aegilops tauschii TaxID=37682 RepID=N1QXV0_AEGTA
MDPAALPGEAELAPTSPSQPKGDSSSPSVSSPSAASPARGLPGDGDGEAGRSSGGVSKSSSRSNTCTAVVSAKLTRRERFRAIVSSSVAGDWRTAPPLVSMGAGLGVVELGFRRWKRCGFYFL